MKKKGARTLTILSLAALGTVGAAAQTPDSQTTLVTAENYNRAQTAVNFAGVVKNGGFGKFKHGRELAPPVQQGIVRPNRDTLYSFAVVDLDAGPAAITLPEAGKSTPRARMPIQFQSSRHASQAVDTPASSRGNASNGRSEHRQPSPRFTPCPNPVHRRVYDTAQRGDCSADKVGQCCTNFSPPTEAT
jgi:hypothetical protein